MSSSSISRQLTIEPEIIKVFHKYTFNYPQEICANLKKTDKGLVPHNILKGKFEEYMPGKFRGTCSHQSYNSNIFHSHPSTSYAYPSPEDVINVIKHHGTIKNSFIATKWGVWVISNTLISNIYSSPHHDIIYKSIKKIINQIGLSTLTSEEDRKIHPDKSRDLKPEDYILLGKLNNELSSMLNIKFDIYIWDDILLSGLNIINE